MARLALTLGAALFCHTVSQAATPAAFYSLGNGSFIDGVSTDGSTVVGVRSGYQIPTGLLVWTAVTGPQLIGSPAGSSGAPTVAGVSGNGAIVVGSTTLTSGGERAWMWTAANQFTILPTFGGNPTTQEATAISSNGAVLGGINGNFQQTYSMVLWSSAGSVTGTVPSQNSNSRITPAAFSADGSVAVGRDPASNAFRWTQATGLVNVGAWNADAVSADGNIVVGTTSGFSGSQAYVWVAGQGMQNLGFLNAGDTYSEATGISADGSTVVGYSSGSPGGGIFIWDAVHGMRDLHQLMTLNGLDTSTWSTLSNGTVKISGDGKTLAGNGISSLGNEGWIATNVVSATYSMWQASLFTPTEQADPTISGPAATPAQDGISNLLKFACGLPPKVPASSGLSTLAWEGSNLIFRYNASTLITGATYTVQTSSDLNTWSDLVATPAEESRTGTTKTLRVTIPSAVSSAFVRLKVDLTGN